MEKDPDRAHVPEDAVMAQIVANEIMNIADAMDMTEEHNYHSRACRCYRRKS